MKKWLITIALSAAQFANAGVVRFTAKQVYHAPKHVVKAAAKTAKLAAKVLY